MRGEIVEFFLEIGFSPVMTDLTAESGINANRFRKGAGV
jgi:hypothetical protein